MSIPAPPPAPPTGVAPTMKSDVDALLAETDPDAAEVAPATAGEEKTD